MKKSISNQARVAKTIRGGLKRMGVKAQVTSHKGGQDKELGVVNVVFIDSNRARLKKAYEYIEGFRANYENMMSGEPKVDEISHEIVYSPAFMGKCYRKLFTISNYNPKDFKKIPDDFIINGEKVGRHTAVLNLINDEIEGHKV
jgi:hypothetical protein